MNDLENIKQKLNLVDVAREYIPSLKKVGRNWSALSPFRNEKTPSFIINEELGIWKDFGGDKAGDVVTLVMEMENVDFRKALEICAAKAGITLTGNIQKNPKEELLKKNVLRMNNYSAELFHYIALKHKAGNKAREYIRKRGFQEETLKKYLIGYAPKNLNLQDILRYKVDKNIDDKLLMSSGLFVERYGKIKDKYQDRLMFPIKNTSGEIVGFSGRVIEKSDDRPKYINSPETVVYKKSNLVFNLFEAKPSIKKDDFVIITEGQVDCIISSQAGVENIVAPLGTSLTIEQLKQIKRYTENICFCFNNDKAGLSALERGFRLASSMSLNISVIELPKEVKDIDELIQKSESKWKEVSRNHQNFLEYLMKRFAKSIDMNNTLEKKRYTNYILGYIKSVKDVVEQSSYLQKLSVIVGISEETLKEALRNQKAIILDTTGNVTNKSEGGRKESSHLPSINLVEYKRNIYFLGLLITYPEFIKKNSVFSDLINDTALKEILNLLLTFVETNNTAEIDHTSLFEYIVKENQKLESTIHDILLQEIDKTPQTKKDLDILFEQLRSSFKKEALKKLKAEFSEKEKINIEEIDASIVKDVLKKK